ncbi:MAG: sodium/proton-translocating pyrophosphatase [Ferruginibacter sp.]
MYWPAYLWVVWFRLYFSALAIRAVGEAAMAMVEEVRRQFRTIPGIMEGTGKPEYDKCVAISTQASIKKMMLPGAIAIVSPLIIGFMPGLGAEALGGFLAGATVSGVLMGMFQNNAGGAWDNAKKSFEKGVEINGQVYYKKSEPHKASVTGDTVGDPFKDTSGPSMNILIKLMSIVSLVIAPTLAEMHNSTASTQNNKTKTSIEKKAVFTSVDESVKGNDKVVSVAGDNLVNQLASDNLLAKNDYSVSLKNGVFTINGNAQPKEIIEKYQSLINAVNSSEFMMQVKQQ